MSAGAAMQRKMAARVRGRQLGDLISIGPAMLRDFELLGIRSVAQLSRQDPQKMYEKLGRVARQHQDICVLDAFCAAVAQARNLAAGRAMPVVVLEQQKEATKQGSKEIKISGDRNKTRK